MDKGAGGDVGAADLDCPGGGLVRIVEAETIRETSSAARPVGPAPGSANPDATRRAREVARHHRRIWGSKPILRRVYRAFFSRAKPFIAWNIGPIIELGGGPGAFKSCFPEVFSSDLVDLPWLDFAADAGRLPLRDCSVGGIVLVDVLHHLPYPQRFFAEAVRVLRPGGRVILLEPHVSILSWPVLHFLHPEPVSLSIRPLDVPADRSLFDPDDPWNSDQGMARAIFRRQARRFRSLFPQLRLVHQSCMSSLMWPLSGGFGSPSRVPRFAEPLLWRIESALERWSEYLGFRALIVLERGE